MLIEFSVENFRSFRDRQTLSMVAGSRLGKKENTFSADVDGEKLPPLLKVAAIYGPNASGKSNLVRALDILKGLAAAQPGVDDHRFDLIRPFRFDKALVNEPSFFEVHFVVNRTRYQFELGVSSSRIHLERLYAFPKGKEKLLYERHFSESEGEEYTFGEALEGGRDVHETWRRLTGPKILFLSQAVANSSEEVDQLSHPYKWLKGDLTVFCSPHMMRNLATASQNLASSMPAMAEQISDFLKANDIPVSGITFDKKEGGDAVLDSFDAERVFDKPKKKMILTHKTKIGDADFLFDEESEGTKNLIGFWLPWSMQSEMRLSKCLVVDELDSSLHPTIVTKLISAHVASSAVTQLIFTTHNTHLMDSKIMRRDQFWLTERDENGATQLRSIHDFEGREGENIEKRYFEGRYRSLPIIKNV